LARQVFVSSNLYGKPLDRMAILKGMLVDLARDGEEASDVERIWNRLREDRGVGFEALLGAIDVIVRARIGERGRVVVQGDHWHLDLAEHLSRNPPAGGIVAWMRNTEALSRSWYTMHRTVERGGDGPIEQSLHRLGLLDWDDWRPLALFYWHRWQMDTANGRRPSPERRGRSERAFDLLHRRCMAMHLGQSAGGRRMALTRAVVQTRAGFDPFSLSPRRNRQPSGALAIFTETRARIDRTLRSQIKSYEIWRPLMLWLEAGRWRPELPRLLRAGSIEHALPRTPPDGTVHDFEEYDRACYSLGNLAVIDRAVNRQLENASFADKLVALRQQAQIYDTVAAIAVHDTWGPDQIAARSDVMRRHVWAELALQPPTPRAPDAHPATAICTTGSAKGETEPASHGPERSKEHEPSS
jgi:hypothetical protein